jgi:uncharacterized membrane protein
MADANHLATIRKRPWGLTFFAILCIGGLVSMPILAGKPGGVEMPEFVRFLGRFHPLLLHLPIGVFSLIVFQEIGAILFRHGRNSGPVAMFPLFFGAASAVVAAIAGFMLFHGDADDYAGNALAERHLWGGLVFAVASVLTFVVKAWTLSLSANASWYRLMLFSSVGVMGFAGHDGASLTHGSDYLTRNAPVSLRKFLGLDTGKKAVVLSAEPVVYVDIVAPILERRCLSCHQQGKTKGGLRMDTYDMLVKGGKNGSAIVPGNAAKSAIVIRMDLPADDEEHMPPEGKPDIEEAELLVLKWWLDQGADPAKTLKDFAQPAPVKEALAKLPAASNATAAVPPDHPAEHTPTVSAPDESLLKSVSELSKQFPGAITFASKESSLVTFSAVSLRGNLGDETFGKFAPVIPHLVNVDLSATQITDKGVAALEPAKQLRQLRLAETSVTDASIDTLLKLPALESINFQGTKVTDSGVLKLATLTNLKHLYLWQTQVKPETIKALQDKLPKCEIISGT